MDARGCQAQRCASASVNVGLGVNLRSGLQKKFCSLHNVLRCLLPIPFYTICRGVMKKCGDMLACRALPNEAGILPQKSLEGRNVPRDDGVSRSLELLYR